MKGLELEVSVSWPLTLSGGRTLCEAIFSEWGWVELERARLSPAVSVNG